LTDDSDLLSVVLAVLCAVAWDREFYCHSVGHYLGLDVHDTNTIGPYRTLEPGVVMAIEPGLYIPSDPQFGRYAGIGVRIEDDVLITQTGCEVR
jgi:Xaa-Pro aminopeptidase